MRLRSRCLVIVPSFLVQILFKKVMSIKLVITNLDIEP